MKRRDSRDTLADSWTLLAGIHITGRERVSWLYIVQVSFRRMIICSQRSTGPKICLQQWIMDIINMTCGEIQSSVGFVFVILPVILNQTLNDPDCEQSWYTEDKRLIADPSDPHKLMYPVTSVSSDRLVTSDCVNLIHEIICDSADGHHYSHETVFRVRNETDSSGPTPTPGSQKETQMFQMFLSA
ncbi:uncharacterized protein LOC125265634 isoform X2 [Megalobrama amblycephala]|uniref:uncharacterized protein LOC125265634 isoform X2 n=1 Tax=Megalobrama amblycephala TaxID=75352 RepID=UPI0020140E7B|nr:uncharacterized protein LOC125265634 isoform X2 [Megalobrama amblycephala]